MPVIAALTLLFGRRGTAPFCLWGAARLASLCLALAWAGPLWLACAYLAETLHYGAPWSRILAPLFGAPGLSWSSGCGIWLLGLVFAALGRGAINVLQARIGGEQSYTARQAAWPLFWLLGAGLFFFATFLLINWPFAGLPEGLGWDRAAMAVFRNASRNYFMSFCPAGAVALVALYFQAGKIGAEHLPASCRWLAFWAAAGCLPYNIVTWGSLMGLGLNPGVSIHQAFRPQALGLICLTAALAAWIFIIWKPRYWRWLAICGFAMLLLKTLLPILLHV